MVKRQHRNLCGGDLGELGANAGGDERGDGGEGVVSRDQIMADGVVL